MNNIDILKKLESLNEDELFYKEYFYAKNDINKLSSFISNLDKDEILKRHLIVPDLLPEIIPYDMKDTTYFELSNNKSVYLLKHNCYTPAFVHKHEFFEIIYVFSGSCTQTIGENRINLKNGDLCFMSQNVLHTLEVFDDSIVINILLCHKTFSDIFFNILRDKSIISTFFTDNLYSKKHVEYIIFHTFNDEILRNEILEIYKEQLLDDEYSDSLINSMITIFFTHLMRKYSNTAELPTAIKTSHNYDLNIINFIQDNYNNVTLNMIAKHFNYSVPYCSKLIKLSTGHNFSELLRNIRLRKSEIMLLSTNMSISDISYNLGYENPETFIRTFKKYYNISPSKFRSNNQNIF